MKTSEVLNKAADLIEERGWGQGPNSMYSTDGVCAMGAIHLAAFGRTASDAVGNCYKDVHLCPAGQVLYRYLVDGDVVEDWEADTIWEWNDERQSAAEVIEVLRAAAVIEAAKETADERVAVTVR